MNSTISDDLSRDCLACHAANNLKEIFTNTKKITSLHTELLEINLSFTTYIEESRRLLQRFRLDLAHEARSSQQVVDILSEKCKKMFNSSKTPRKHYNVQQIDLNNKNVQNNNTNNHHLERQKARAFISWYKHMIDNERQNVVLYLSDDTILEWFGKTIKTRKKVSAFLKYHMQCSRHDFTSVINIDKIESRPERPQRNVDTVLAIPLDAPEQIITTKETFNRKRTHSGCHSPEWDEGCKSLDEEEGIARKRFRKCSENDVDKHQNGLGFIDDSEIHNKGDGALYGKQMHKSVTVTPPNHELGQGDCVPSTSGTDSNKSHDALNAQLPKIAVECNCYVEFIRTKNSYSTDYMKWERKCKIQISYSEDPVNIGEYIIWALHYTDESKCRRNLLPAFEQVAREEEMKRNL